MVRLFEDVVSPCSGSGTAGVAGAASSVSGGAPAGAVGGCIIRGLQENVIPRLGDDITKGVGQIEQTPGEANIYQADPRGQS